MTDPRQELARSMRDHHVDLRTITPKQWLAIFEAFNPEDTREAVALIAQARGLQSIIRAAGGGR